MNASLLANFSYEEIKEAVFQMNGLGASGLDGFFANFFHKNWHSVGQDVCKFVSDVCNFCISLKGVNQIFITLIPKVKNAKMVGDFRSISLCNVLYKIVAKNLANSLNKLPPVIISPHHSAFVLGRLITDNILISYEILHSLVTRIKGKDRYMVLKLDMSKAYDCIK